MELRRYWEIILRYKVMIVSLVLCASLASLASTYVLTDTYNASALVLIRPIDTRRVTDPPAGMREKEVLGFPLVGTNAKVTTRSYAEIIQSRATAKQIVDELKLDQISEPVEPNLIKRAYKYLKKKVKVLIYYTWTFMKYGRIETGDPYDALVEQVKGSITATEIRDSHLVQIDVRSDDPEFAALLANTAANVFVNHWKALYSRDREEDLAILEGQLASNTEELNTMMDALERFKKESALVDIEIEIPEKLSSMSLFEAKLREAQADIKELIREREEIRHQLDRRKKISTAATIVSENPVAIDLREILAGLEIDMAGLKSRFTPTHPEVLALQAKIDETQRRLDAEEARTVSDETSAPDPVYVGMKLRLAEIETKLPALEAKREGYRLTVEKYRQEVEAIRNKTKELDRMESRLDILKKLNTEFVAEVNDVRVLTSKNPEEARLISPATPSLYPSGPIKIIYLAVAALVSLVIAVALAFFLEYINIRIRTIEEAESALALPVLASIPRIKKLAEAEFPDILTPESTPGTS